MFIIFFIFSLIKPIEVQKIDFKKQDIETLKKPWVGYVKDITGKAFINRYNDDGTKIMFNTRLYKHTLIHHKDEINVASKSKVDILLTKDNTLSLSQNTVFKIFKHEATLNKQNSFFSLLWGTVKANVNKLGKGSDYKMQTPNSTIGVRGTEFVAQYNGLNKTTKVACLEGLVSVKTVVDEKEETIREQIVKPNQYMKVETVLENGIAQNQVKEAKNFSRKILTGIDVVFDTEEESKTDVWDYTQISSSFLRFSTGVKYANLEQVSNMNPYTPVYIRYNPLFHLFSFFYIEPALDFTPMSSNSYMLRALVNFNFQVYNGFYLGAGYGGSTSNQNTNDISEDETGTRKYSHGVNFTLGYTFSEKFYGVIDGLKLSYEIDKRSADPEADDKGFDNEAIVFGVVINFQEGRERW